MFFFTLIIEGWSCSLEVRESGSQEFGSSGYKTVGCVL
jgi:hypothetical protein